MGLETKSKFYYGYTVDSNNNKIDFNEGGGELTGTLSFGDYSMTDFASELSVALNDAGGQTYTVSVDRDTRAITISASLNFDLLISSGTNSGTSVYTTAGFTGADQTSTNSYTGSATGSEYKPQFLLDQYVPSENNKERLFSTRKESASGKVEVVSFGTVSNVTMNITFITDINQGTNGAIETDLSGVSNARLFLDHITEVKPVEFMPDRDTTSTFEKLILLSTPQSKDGTNYELKELFSKGLANYYETGKLLFRVQT